MLSNMMNNNNESAIGPRILVYLVLDVSGSMCGASIEAVNEGLLLIAGELKRVPEAVEMANVCVVTFSTGAKVERSLSPVMSFTPPVLLCGGNTNMAAALRLVDQLIDKEFRPTFEGQARGDYKPTIFLLTDGAPDDLNDTVRAANQLRNRKAGQTIGTFVALGCGPGANEENLRKIAPIVALMPQMDAEKIKAFFKWVSASIAVASRSASKAAGGAEVQAGAPPVPEDGSGAPAFHFKF